jgi:maltose phosphorylase
MVQWDSELILKSYSGDTFQELYCRNILSDKTKVGWWKNGYPQYLRSFKCSNWIGIDIEIMAKLDLKLLPVQPLKHSQLE